MPVLSGIEELDALFCEPGRELLSCVPCLAERGEKADLTFDEAATLLERAKGLGMEVAPLLAKALWKLNRSPG